MGKALTHLNPAENRLAQFVIQADPFKATGYKFDEHLGEGIPQDPNWPPYIQTMARTLTQRRVDMIAFSAAGDWIIELKERGSAAAIGQLLVYKNLYTAKYPQRKIAGLVLVAPYMGYDLESTIQAAGILVITAESV